MIAIICTISFYLGDRVEFLTGHLKGEKGTIIAQNADCTYKVETVVIGAFDVPWLVKVDRQAKDLRKIQEND